MNDRIERLKSDAAELNVSKGAARDGLWQTVGAIAMAAGVVLAFVAYQLSLGKDDPRDIDSLQILAVAMLGASRADAQPGPGSPATGPVSATMLATQQVPARAPRAAGRMSGHPASARTGPPPRSRPADRLRWPGAGRPAPARASGRRRRGVTCGYTERGRRRWPLAGAVAT